MTFLYPQFLFALFTILLPIIIHLFNFRQHKIVYFSNVAFLKNISQETKSKSQLKHLLILLARILTIIMLVFAFAQPFIPNNNTNAKSKVNQIGIFVDNSFSMNSEGKFGNTFQLAKNKAFNILEAYSNNTNIILQDNDLESKNQHLLNKESVFDLILEQKISSNSQKFSNVYSKILNLFSTDSDVNKNVYIISDFQKTNFDFENLSYDKDVNLVIVPLTVEKNNNLFIDSVWFDSPFRLFGKEEKISVKIINSSDEKYTEIPINMYINDTIKTVSSFNIDPNSEIIVELDYTNTHKGINNCKIELTDYPITFDNSFYFSYNINKKINLLIINEKINNHYLNKLFGEDENISVENFNSGDIKTSEFFKQNIIILCELKEYSSGLISELTNFISNGGNVLIIPNSDGNIISYNKLLTSLNSDTFREKDTTDTRIETINLNHIIYTDVFKEIDENSEFPILNQYFKFNKTSFSNDIVLLESENKTKVLSFNNYKKGNLYVLNIPLDENFSNFAKHPIFVPTLYNIVLYSISNNQIYYKIGIDEIISLNNIEVENSEIVQIKNITSNYEFIPQIISETSNVFKINMMNNVKEAGNYLLKEGENDITGLSFNYLRNESEMDFYTDTEISENLNKLGYSNIKIISNDNISIKQEVEILNNGKQLWKMFIVFALLFIGIEIVLIKLWK